MSQLKRPDNSGGTYQCIKCGQTDIPASARFCPECGTFLGPPGAPAWDDTTNTGQADTTIHAAGSSGGRIYGPDPASRAEWRAAQDEYDEPAELPDDGSAWLNFSKEERHAERTESDYWFCYGARRQAEEDGESPEQLRWLRADERAAEVAMKSARVQLDRRLSEFNSLVEEGRADPGPSGTSIRARVGELDELDDSLAAAERAAEQDRRSRTWWPGRD